MSGIEVSYGLPISEDQNAADIASIEAKREGLVILSNNMNVSPIGKRNNNPTPWNKVKEVNVYDDHFDVVFKWNEKELKVGHVPQIKVDINKDEPFAVHNWINEERKLVMWARQSGQKVVQNENGEDMVDESGNPVLMQLKDGTPIYNMEIPKVNILCTIPDPDGWKLNKKRLTNENGAIRKRAYATIAEFEAELAEELANEMKLAAV